MCEDFTSQYLYNPSPLSTTSISSSRTNAGTSGSWICIVVTISVYNSIRYGDNVAGGPTSCSDTCAPITTMSCNMAAMDVDSAATTIPATAYSCTAIYCSCIDPTSSDAYGATYASPAATNTCAVRLA